MLAWDLALRLWAHWKGVLVVLVAGGVLWGLWASLDAYGDRRAAEAVLPWQEAARKAAEAAGVAQAAADARTEREAREVAQSNRRWLDVEVENARLRGDNAALLRGLRQRPAAARCDPVQPAAPDAGSSTARAQPREFPTDDWLDLAAAAVRCADERELNAAAVREGRATWPVSR